MDIHAKHGLAALAAAAASGTAPIDAQAQQAEVAVTQRCLTVRADQEWRPTGIRVAPNDFVCVAGEGLWSHGAQGEQAVFPYYGPEGYGKDNPVDARGAVLHVGALVGRIGPNAPFLIRQQACFVPRTAGELGLSMDDVSGAFGNNRGSLRVLVGKWPVSALPQRVSLDARVCGP